MKRPITIISSISIALFLIAIIGFGSGLYNDKKNGTQKADERYAKLLSATKENFSNAPYGTSEFAKSFIQAIGNIDDFSSLKLEVNDTLVYSYPPETFSLPSPELVKSYKDTVYLSDNNFTLKASIYLMNPSSIYNHSRLAFLLILIGTVIVGIFILFYSGTKPNTVEQITSRRKGKKFQSSYGASADRPALKAQEYEQEVEQKEPKEPIKEEAPQKSEETEEKEVSFDDSPAQEKAETNVPIFNPEQAESDANEEADIPSTENAENDESEEISISFPESEPVFSSEDEEAWNDDDLFADNEDAAIDEGGLDIIDQLEQENKELSESDDTFAAESPETEENIPAFPTEEAQENTETTQIPSVSPVTNLNLQSVLEQKLDETIESGNQASLALVKINGLDRGNEISQNIVSILRSADSQATLFEYKADSYAVILSDTDLQSTVDNFEGIYNKITDFLKDNNAVNEVSIGISSVSKRKIKAERIILEASQALDYASGDPDSPIVAFRANPEKYRELEDSQV